MKKLVVMVGPMGSGKSTIVSTTYSDYTRISQDVMGANGHMTEFSRALKRGDDIVIDRINHTRDQRARYITMAKEAGYHTKIHSIHSDYRTCLNRIVNRTGHQTIPNGDTVTAKKALDMYFNQYEPVSSKEADETFSGSVHNAFAHDHTLLSMEGFRIIVVGDIHGCFQDFQNLLTKLNYSEETDAVISCGDLVDRGPEIDKVLTWFMTTPNAYTVRGNHDDKFLRYLRGNKVNTESLGESIRQTAGMDKEALYNWFMNTPHVITFDRYAVCHAGFHPDYKPELNSREFCMYARKYDPSIRTFTNDNTAPYWYEFKRKNDYMLEREVLFFGHEIHEEICLVKKTDTEEIYALDGGCYMGGTLRAAVIDQTKHGIQIVEVESTQPKIGKDNPHSKWDHINKFEPYDKLVEQGFLNKQESGDLVLYNYTDQCTYQKMWNKYTLESRGLILNKVTGDTVARPFPKFFNLGENQNVILSKMPNEPYECYEKVDGSLGILYKDPATNSWKIATRGSFQSEQAKTATDMFNNVPEYQFCSHAEVWEEYVKVFPEFADYTLLFEIIYPENRVNPGARLVCDYGSTRTLILLGAIHKVSGKDLSRRNLEIVAENIGLPVVKKFDHTIEQMIELQKTLPATEEGFVVKYESGFRVKIKGHEYCKMQRILNSITPLFMWELMKESPDFILAPEYLMTIPEEILPEVTVIESKLMGAFIHTMSQIESEYKNWIATHTEEEFAVMEEKAKLKSLGLWSQNPDNKVSHKSALFPYHKGEFDKVRKHAMLTVRPTSNIIK